MPLRLKPFVWFAHLWFIRLLSRKETNLWLRVQARGSLAGNNGALTEKPGGSHAPKEYNKENIPEASLRTFADVKGVTEAKEELQVPAVSIPFLCA